jgi:penicillin amidase
MRRVNAALATAVAVLVMTFLAAGFGQLPALGTVLSPGGGVWGSANDGKAVGPRTVRLSGMHDAANVSFDSAGVPDVRAGSDRDMFLVQGYLEATFRLSQMDLERRTALGRLAQLDGPGDVESDTFELQVGLARTAEATWAATPPESPQGQALTAFSQGVNDRLAELRHSGDWPAVFALTGVYPQDWTPVDSLAIQGLMTQYLDYTTGPLDYAVLTHALGAAHTMAWLPVIAADAQRPYDPGPYQNLGISPLPLDADANAAVPTGAAAAVPGDTKGAPGAAKTAPGGDTMTTAPGGSSARSAAAAQDMLAKIAALPATQVHLFPDSNAWAANGPAVSGGLSMLAGDPHLPLTLPSLWYQMALASPETTVTGASLVGGPGIVIGRNQRIAWSVSDVQSQATFYYNEQTSPEHPGQYFWRGAWRNMQKVHYTIPVRGGKTVPLTVDLTVHGPVMTQVGQTTSVSWTGNYPSNSVEAIIGLDKAQNYQQFHAALGNWHTPALNFTYADGRGNIGIVAAGYFRQIAAGDPWMPLPGTGQSDVVGTIPAAAAPQVYNPPGHVVVAANQRPVGADYPYYIGTSMETYANGYRADQIYQSLDGRQGMTAADFSALQNNVTDYLSTLIVPKLTDALQDASLDPEQHEALGEITGWDNQMTATSTGATIWWTFWNNSLTYVFRPWWDAGKIPVYKNSTGLDISVAHPAEFEGPPLVSLDEDLEAWTLHDPTNAAFSPPGRPGDATSAMRAAFAETVSQLRSKLGADATTWHWGRLHTRAVPALTGADGLGYGPKPADGDYWTVDSADGWINSTFGPSWRMVVDWTGPATATASAIYPGGQSENPASPWYETFIADWWNGRLRPLAMPGDQPRSTVVWTLQPGG